MKLKLIIFICILFGSITLLSKNNSVLDMQQITITKPTVIFWSITDNGIKFLKKEYGEDDFYTIADDQAYYFSLSIRRIENAKINKIYTGKKVLKINYFNKKMTISKDQKKYKGSWIAIIFIKNKKPMFLSYNEFSEMPLKFIKGIKPLKSSKSN